MATSTKVFLFLSWIFSLFGESLSGISWRCPTEEMVSSDYGCYLFHTGSLAFDEAESYCWSVDATLVWIHSQDEMIFLAGQALQLPQVNAWLIGLHTRSEHKDLMAYFWSSGHKMSFTAWSDIEPDHYGNEKCVAMELKYGYRWTTVPCERQRSFICKADPPFFRLKNPILLGILGVISILLIILVFVLCTMRNRPSNTCQEHKYCTQESSANTDGCRHLDDALILNHLPSQPTAPPVDNRYTTLPTIPPAQQGNSPIGDPLDHIYEDVDGHRRKTQGPETATLQRTPQPTNPYLMWA